MRLYGSHDVTAEGDFFLKGVELISRSYESQRLAFIASEDYPGDIAILTPGDEYESELGKLKPI